MMPLPSPGSRWGTRCFRHLWRVIEANHRLIGHRRRRGEPS
jgi:hypothetical protein